MQKPAMKVNSLIEKAIEESERAKPTDRPSYWAKRSCNKCYGRGVTGMTETKKDGNIYRNGIVCVCATRTFTKWRDAWVAEYLKKHTEL